MVLSNETVLIEQYANDRSPKAKFLKLLGKIFIRLLFQRKYVDIRNFVGKCLWNNLRSSKEDFEKG